MHILLNCASYEERFSQVFRPIGLALFFFSFFFFSPSTKVLVGGLQSPPFPMLLRVLGMLILVRSEAAKANYTASNP